MSQRGGFGSGYGATVQEYRDDPDSVFTDQQSGFRGSGRFDDLLEKVSDSIHTINNGANSIDRAMKLIGTNKDSVQLRDRIHETSKSTHETVNSSMKLFKSLSKIRAVDKQQKFRLERLRGDFQESVQRFTSLQKKAADKVKTSAMLGSIQSTQEDTSGTSWLDESERQKLVEAEERKIDSLQAQEQIIEDDLALINERTERIHQLEADILDVNEIFRDLGAMIHEQGEVIDTIEANVVKASDNVEAGAEQLSKASKYQRKSRKKMCCLLLILLIVAAVVTLIIVLSVKG